jgi:hypothetical protein
MLYSATNIENRKNRTPREDALGVLRASDFENY